MAVQDHGDALDLAASGHLPESGFTGAQHVTARSPDDLSEASFRLGWYLYLLARERLEVCSSNAVFVRCLQLVLGALGTVLWNGCRHTVGLPPPGTLTSVREIAESAPASGEKGETCQAAAGAPKITAAIPTTALVGSGSAPVPLKNERRTPGSENGVSNPGLDGTGSSVLGTGGGADGGVGVGVDERLFLEALSVKGRCQADGVAAMKVHVVGTAAELLKAGKLVSVPSDSQALDAMHGVRTSGDETVKATGIGDHGGGALGLSVSAVEATPTAQGHEEAPPKRTESAGVRDMEGSRPLEGIFHPSVVIENVRRLDECYWLRVSAAGGIRVLDEAFVLSPSLRQARVLLRARGLHVAHDDVPCGARVSSR